ncbi:flagellar hook-length control protein FliK (plasmid) [Pontibacillus sp. ALD_SL1]|uniref:flagellar hook-length control protein FliK n=1 Tax=Pontibacillus sp. ALD_SL1 TaxID=2777185 RepID=UPI001A963A3E|nr:flagellar hook-length control protein FliK [Pontibacillus sp. ALD_SL1]QST03037.1 flagellar hook-length control protein FliK [Pontibacillus sp. ALD_SL1]
MISLSVMDLYSMVALGGSGLKGLNTEKQSESVFSLSGIKEEAASAGKTAVNKAPLSLRLPENAWQSRAGALPQGEMETKLSEEAIPFMKIQGKEAVSFFLEETKGEPLYMLQEEVGSLVLVPEEVLNKWKAVLSADPNQENEQLSVLRKVVEAAVPFGTRPTEGMDDNVSHETLQKDSFPQIKKKTDNVSHETNLHSFTRKEEVISEVTQEKTGISNLDKNAESEGVAVYYAPRNIGDLLTKSIRQETTNQQQPVPVPVPDGGRKEGATQLIHMNQKMVDTHDFVKQVQFLRNVEKEIGHLTTNANPVPPAPSPLKPTTGVLFSKDHTTLATHSESGADAVLPPFLMADKSTPSLIGGSEEKGGATIGELKASVAETVKVYADYKFIGPKKISLSLNPNHLGSVQVVVEKTGDVVQAHIKVTEESAKGQVERAMEQVRDEMRERNIDFQFRVEEKRDHEERQEKRKEQHNTLKNNQTNGAEHDFKEFLLSLGGEEHGDF